MLSAAFVLVLATAALWAGGEQFVLGSTRVAERLRIPTILVGMVVAGFGTSTPELTVSLLARARGESALAIGNAFGSNVANVILVLPVAALAASFGARATLVHREVAAVLAATALAVGFAADGRVTRPEAAILVGAFGAIMLWLARSALRSPGRSAIEAEIDDLVGAPPRPVAREATRTLLGLGVVLAGADRLVWAATRIARDLGVSEAAIGLTIVAVGTSLPELVTSVIAVRRREADLALGNVLGSNVFNALLVVGLAGLAGPLAIGGTAKVIALAGAGGTAVLLTLLLVPGYRLTRAHAVLGLAGYAAFVAALFATS